MNSRCRFIMRPREESAAFTRVELCAVLVALGVLVTWAWPALAGSRTRVDRLVCVSNLGDIGRAYNQWAAEHSDTLPHLLTVAEGGTRTPFNGLEGNPWFQFSWVSNELRTPRVLACPSDVLRRPASDFSFAPGGLLHPTARNNAISYFLAYPTYPTGHRVLSGDRNVSVPVSVGGCSIFGGVLMGALYTTVPVQAPWTSELHRDAGNVLFRDGSVIQTADGLGGVIGEEWANGIFHLIIP